MRTTEKIIHEVGKVYVGNAPAVRKILLAMLAGGHVLLEDIPGVGKTTLALAFSSAMALGYKRIQFTPDVMPTDITGFTIYNKETRSMDYMPGAALCNLLLADELNRAPSRTQAALLETMEEYQVTVDGETHVLPQPFMVIATQNPVGSSGTQLLPDSQMDRFMLRLSLGYPDTNGEMEVLRRKHGKSAPSTVLPVTDAEELLKMRREVSSIYIAPNIYNYIVRLVRATREHPAVVQGVSPRGSVALMGLAQAAAYLVGRDYVVPQDIQATFEDCTSHRMLLTPQALQQKLVATQVAREVLETVAAPTPGERT